MVRSLLIPSGVLPCVSTAFPLDFPTGATISALPSPDGPPWFGPKALIVVLVTPATRH